jgi:hypothetical protein
MSWTRRKNQSPTPQEEADRALKARHSSNSEIPYIEADSDSGEIPLDELDTFVIPARDEKGIGVPVNLHIPPYLERQIEIVVASRRFPYLRAADFIRHACVRHLAWLISIRFSIPRHMTSTMATILDAFRDEEFTAQVELAFSHMDRLVTSHINRGDKIEAIRLYVRIRSRIQETAACAWRDRFLREFDKKYSHLMAVERRPIELVEEQQRGA